MRFKNRNEAGLQLATRLMKWKGSEALVLALPRGGVPVGYAIASELTLPLDIILVRKIGHPANPEFAIGAAGPEEMVVDDREDVSAAYLEQAMEKVRARLKEMDWTYRKGYPPPEIKGRHIIVADDGVATGHTMALTLDILRKQEPASITVALPVSSREAAQLLSRRCDTFICLYIPPFFTGVGAFYEDFGQVSDETVIELLTRSRKSAESHTNTENR